jgi:hypothetical protein
MKIAFLQNLFTRRNLADDVHLLRWHCTDAGGSRDLGLP